MKKLFLIFTIILCTLPSISQDVNYNCLKDFLLQRSNAQSDFIEHKLLIYYMNYLDINTCNRDKYQTFSSIFKQKDSTDSIRTIIIIGGLSSKDTSFKRIVDEFMQFDYLFFDNNDEIKNCIGLKANITTIKFDEGFKYKGRDNKNDFNYSETPQFYNNYLLPFESNKLPKLDISLLNPNKFIIQDNNLFVSDGISYNGVIIDLNNFSIIKETNFRKIKSQQYDNYLDSIQNYKEISFFLRLQKKYLITLPNYDYGLIEYKNQILNCLALPDSVQTFLQSIRPSYAFHLSYYLYDFNSNLKYHIYNYSNVFENYVLINNGMNYVCPQEFHGSELVITDNNFQGIDTLIIDENFDKFNDFYLASNNNNKFYFLNGNSKIFVEGEYNGKLDYRNINPQGILKLIFDFQNYDVPEQYYGVNIYPTINYQVQNMFCYNDDLIIFIKGKFNDGFIQVYNTNDYSLRAEKQISFFKSPLIMHQIKFIGVHNEDLLFLCKYSDDNWYINRISIDKLSKK